MNIEETTEMIEYYRSQGAPQDQQMLVALLRQTQESSGGVIPMDILARIADAYEMKQSMLLALIRRIPSLRLENAAHRLEVCGTCRAGAKLRDFIERTYGVKSGTSNEAYGFSYRVTPCMKNCKNGPSVRWDGQLHGNADEALLRKLIAGKEL